MTDIGILTTCMMSGTTEELMLKSIWVMLCPLRAFSNNDLDGLFDSKHAVKPTEPALTQFARFSYYFFLSVTHLYSQGMDTGTQYKTRNILLQIFLVQSSFLSLFTNAPNRAYISLRLTDTVVSNSSKYPNPVLNFTYTLSWSTLISFMS